MVATHKSILIRQATIIDSTSPFHRKVVDVLIEGGKIISIAKRLSQKASLETSIPNLHLSQGFIDVFADYCEPGYEHKETIATGKNAAAAGGFTQVFLAPNTSPSVSTKSSVNYIVHTNQHHPVQAFPIGSLTQHIEGKTLAEMYDMKTAGAVAFSDGWKPLQYAGLMLKALEYVKAFDGVVIQLPVDASLASGGLMHEGVTSTRLGMPGVPILAETSILHRDIELLRYTQSKLHISGLSTAEGVAMIRKAKKEGLQITCSVTPYHLVLSDASLQDYDSLYKVTPVLRSEKDRQALIKGLADGTIDSIASHHRPQDWDAKAKEFEYASDGMNIQEIAFSIVHNAIGDKVPLERLIDAFTHVPRAIFGLSIPTINEGTTANLCLFLPNEYHTVSAEKLQSQSANNPFIGQSLRGTINGIIHQQQTILNEVL